MEYDKSEIEGCGQGVQGMLGALNPMSSFSNGNDGAGEPPSKSPPIDSRDAATTPVSEGALGRLIRSEFAPDELPSLIETTLMHRDVRDKIRRLSKDDAQDFVDVIDEALDRPDLIPEAREICLRQLYRTCGYHALLPRALKVPICYDRTDIPLYRGGYADVWKGEYHGREVAVKVIRTYSTSDLRRIVGRFCKEVVTWKTLQHPNILPLIGVTMSEVQFAMISEWMFNGNINEFVKANPGENRLKLLGDVARGLIYIHQQGMVHGDLKGANILIDQTRHARLADFGLLTIVSNPASLLPSSSPAQGGTARWMSPELITPRDFGLDASCPTKSSDCYSLGMVIYETISGNLPFREDTDLMVIAKVLKGERPRRAVGFTDGLWEILERCWTPQPSERPRVEDVLRFLDMCSNFSALPSPGMDGGTGAFGFYDLSEEEDCDSSEYDTPPDDLSSGGEFFLSVEGEEQFPSNSGSVSSPFPPSTLTSDAHLSVNVENLHTGVHLADTPYGIASGPQLHTISEVPIPGGVLPTVPLAGHPGGSSPLSWSERTDDHKPAHSTSEDLNRSEVLPFSLPTSIPSISSSTHRARTTSSSVASANSRCRTSTPSFHSVGSDTSDPTSSVQPPSTIDAAATTVATTCSACGKRVQGECVLAFGGVFHLNCFKCLDCGDIVASKFLPIEGSDGKQHPLCERDYFRRLNLICAKCGMALRGSYITACNKKYHVEHLTCSICPTLFGPDDSYYEHDGNVYCHYHYSTRFATKCAGCGTAILKQSVEINRNMKDECWHPECYMINKSWNVKVVSRRPTSSTIQEWNAEPPYVEEERTESAVTLKEKQIHMEQQLCRIWTVLSYFEKSSAVCISDMLRQVSNGHYLSAIHFAEVVILHVKVLFSTMDDFEHHFTSYGLKEMPHEREARMLCRAIVDLFTLLSHTQQGGARRTELLALMTRLAHYRKILIRIALTGALKLEQDCDAHEPMTSFLDKLQVLAIQGASSSAKRLSKKSDGETPPSPRSPDISTEGVVRNFRSLDLEYAGESQFLAPSGDPSLTSIPPIDPPSNLCVRCDQMVEEDCVRLGIYQRWHSNCIQCFTCGEVAAAPLPKDTNSPGPDDEDKDDDESEYKERDKDEEGTSSKPSTARRPPANVGFFVYEIRSSKDTAAFGPVPNLIYCVDHAGKGCRGGFQNVSRLEQYSFLLSVALRRWYVLLKNRGAVPASPVESPVSASNRQDPYRNSGDVHIRKPFHLDRKLSATAHIPKLSTMMESPAGETARTSDMRAWKRSQEPISPQSPTQIQASISQSQQVIIQQRRPTRQPYRQQPVQLSLVPSQHQEKQGQPSTQGAPRPMLSPETSFFMRGFKPLYTRGNNEVKAIEYPVPTSLSSGTHDNDPPDVRSQSPDDWIVLTDIPQLMQEAQEGSQSRLLPGRSAVPFIAELSALELAIIKHSAAVVLSNSSLKDQMDMDEIFELLETKKGGFWNRLFKPSGSGRKDAKKKGVFGVPLELLVEREGADSFHGASRTPLRVPSFIDDVVSAMRQMDMSMEGLFCKNGNIVRLKNLADAIDRDTSSVDLTQDNAVQLGALLKKFLRELPEPLLTFKLHHLLVASQSMPTEEERQRMLHMVSLLLPKCHRDTMEVLFVFLKWVASFAHVDEVTGSKMDLPNLAAVISSSILCSRRRGDESFGSVQVITQLLENQDVYYRVPEEFLSILRDKEQFAPSMKLSSKDFMKKCEDHLKNLANGRLLKRRKQTR